MTPAVLLLLTLLGAPPARMHPYAPPTIPHALEPGVACTACHGPEREGGVPAIPHRVQGDCRGCHVPRGATPPRKPGAQAPLPRTGPRAPRAYPGAPPRVAHPVFMRENCLACHGKSPRPGVRNPHPQRRDCLSCHAKPPAS